MASRHAKNKAIEACHAYARNTETLDFFSSVLWILLPPHLLDMLVPQWDWMDCLQNSFLSYAHVNLKQIHRLCIFKPQLFILSKLLSRYQWSRITLFNWTVVFLFPVPISWGFLSLQFSLSILLSLCNVHDWWDKLNLIAKMCCDVKVYA